MSIVDDFKGIGNRLNEIEGRPLKHITREFMKNMLGPGTGNNDINTNFQQVAPTNSPSSGLPWVTTDPITYIRNVVTGDQMCVGPGAIITHPWQKEGPPSIQDPGHTHNHAQAPTKATV